VSDQIIKRSARQLGRRGRQLARQAQAELEVPVIGVSDQNHQTIGAPARPAQSPVGEAEPSAQARHSRACRGVPMSASIKPKTGPARSDELAGADAPPTLMCIAYQREIT
jgi:hypothetical protein